MEKDDFPSLNVEYSGGNGRKPLTPKDGFEKFMHDLPKQREETFATLQEIRKADGSLQPYIQWIMGQYETQEDLGAQMMCKLAMLAIGEFMEEYSS